MDDNSADVMPETAKRIERNVQRIRPFERLLLLDVVRDPESRPLFLWTGAALLIGTFAYHWLEGWSYLDSLYFCLISVATIGYGDYVPTTAVAKVFTMFYVINGIVILLALLDRIRAVRSRTLTDDGG